MRSTVQPLAGRFLARRFCHCGAHHTCAQRCQQWSMIGKRAEIARRTGSDN